MKSASELRCLCLTGFMGAGKTMVGRVVAQQQGRRFVDLDERIEARENRTIAQIFAASGEGAFREAESAALRALLDGTGAESLVLALGGGTLQNPENAASLRQANVLLVFLDAPARELRDRCSRQSVMRPLLQEWRQFQHLYEARRASYLQADWRINTSGLTLDKVAEEISQWLDRLRDGS